MHLPYLVLYNTSGMNANACVVSREDLSLTFVADYTSFVYHTDNEDEAYYLATFLNASLPNRLMKPFQARGLLGPRHVCKKILEVPLPRYAAGDEQHRALAELGRRCAKQARSYLMQQETSPESMTTHALGKLRKELKEVVLADELKKADDLLKAIWSSL